MTLRIPLEVTDPTFRREKLSVLFAQLDIGNTHTDIHMRADGCLGHVYISQQGYTIIKMQRKAKSYLLQKILHAVANATHAVTHGHRRGRWRHESTRWSLPPGRRGVYWDTTGATQGADSGRRRAGEGGRGRRRGRGSCSRRRPGGACCSVRGANSTLGFDVDGDALLLCLHLELLQLGHSLPERLLGAQELALQACRF